MQLEGHQQPSLSLGSVETRLGWGPFHVEGSSREAAVLLSGRIVIRGVAFFDSLPAMFYET